MKILNGTEFCGMAYRAHQLDGHATAAYWLEAKGYDVAYHRNMIANHVRDLADQLGLVLVDPDAAKTEETK